MRLRSVSPSPDVTEAYDVRGELRFDPVTRVNEPAVRMLQWIDGVGIPNGRTCMVRSPASLGAERVPLGWMTQRHLVPLADSRMKGRALSVTIWLASATVYWVLLALIARIPTATAMRVTDVLFVVALPLTYGAILGGVLGLSGRPREAALRATAVTLGLILALGLLELAAVARIAHWELVFRLCGESSSIMYRTETWVFGTCPACDGPDGREATSNGVGTARDDPGSDHRYLRHGGYRYRAAGPS